MSGLITPSLAETMSAQEIDMVYPVLTEVHILVAALLERNADFIYRSPNRINNTFRFAHADLETPFIALKALQTHIGRSLPIYDHDGHGYRSITAQPSGRTRIITRDDIFQVVHGPRETKAPGRFITWIAKE